MDTAMAMAMATEPIMPPATDDGGGVSVLEPAQAF